MNDGCRITFLENSLTTEDISLACWKTASNWGVRMVLGENSLAMKDSRCGSGMKVARSASAIARKWKSMQILRPSPCPLPEGEDKYSATSIFSHLLMTTRIFVHSKKS